MSKDLFKYAEINTQGSILMGNHTVVDGYQFGRKIGILSHIHTDHMEHLSKALHECFGIYMSPPTFDLLAALNSTDYNVSAETFFEGRRIYRVDFDKPFRPQINTRDPNATKIYGDKFTLISAQHILGSAQVLVETEDCTRILYSSDFSYPDTKPIKCDVLVLDSTHGSPKFDVSVDSPSIERRLVEYIDCEIQQGHSICIRSHVGRLQYIMSLLSSEFPSIPFLTSDRNNRIASVYNRRGFAIKDRIIYGSLQSEEMLAKSNLFIEFKSINESLSPAELDGRATVFQLGGHFLGSKTAIRLPKDEYEKNVSRKYNLEFADHASYEQIIKYVEKCDPDLVITDSYRNTNCVELANRITDELNINTTHQPK